MSTSANEQHEKRDSKDATREQCAKDEEDPTTPIGPKPSIGSNPI